MVLLANIIQGITGFAGTILAMPPSLMLVGYGVAKPVLNVLGLLSGIYVLAGNRKSVCWKELKKIVSVMAAGILAGAFQQGLFARREEMLFKLLGLFILFLSVQGMYLLWTGRKRSQSQALILKSSIQDQSQAQNQSQNTLGSYLLLGLAGLIHGIFVSGGPLLISYLTKRIQDKVSFRATISTVWVVLNSLVLLTDIRAGLWHRELIAVQLIAIPFLLLGMFIGSKLYVRMSQQVFMIITYVLLFVSGISLLVK